MLGNVDPAFLRQRDIGAQSKTKKYSLEPLFRTQPQTIYNTSPVEYSHIPPSSNPASSMDKLPVELLAHIFLLATHSTSQKGTDNSADELENDNLPFDPANITTPLAISAVNGQWRQIALSTPTLWTSICVVWEPVDDSMEVDESSRPLSDFQYPTTMNTPHINTSLVRSGSSPIDIIIDARDPDWEFGDVESGCVIKFCTGRFIHLAYH
jgi:hypothetical protein